MEHRRGLDEAINKPGWRQWRRILYWL